MSEIPPVVCQNCKGQWDATSEVSGRAFLFLHKAMHEQQPTDFFDARSLHQLPFILFPAVAEVMVQWGESIERNAGEAINFAVDLDRKLRGEPKP